MGVMNRAAGAAILLGLAGCAAPRQDIRRLTPATEDSRIPSECKIAGVLRDSPAQRAGLETGDTIQTVNGVVPKNAEDVSDLIGKAPEATTLAVTAASGQTKNLAVTLNKTRPRLGAVCDFSGWRKPGLTSAGNESVTVFGGPVSFTASGIFEKKLAFMRVRVGNNTNDNLSVDPAQFAAYDAGKNPLPMLTPHQVMCFLFGEKGARYLNARHQQKQTMDGDTGAPAEAQETSSSCAGMTTVGHVSGADVQYAQANADYLAKESLWPTTVKPGETVDGLIYLEEPAALPFTLSASLAGYNLAVTFGEIQGSTKVMSIDELSDFFNAEKKGAPLRITTKKGRVFVGKFLQYDDDNERAWFQSNSGLLNSVSYPLKSIRSAESIDQVPEKPTTATDHID